MPTTTCRHIRATGVRCGSPALRGEPLCYYHHRDATLRRQARERDRNGIETIIHPLNPDADGLQRNPLVQEYFSSQRGPATFDFPALEDRESIQIAVSMLLAALGQGAVEPRRASVMLYALQVASANARTLVRDPQTVTLAIQTPEGQDLAADEDPEPAHQPPGSAERFLQELENLGALDPLAPTHQHAIPVP